MGILDFIGGLTHDFESKKFRIDLLSYKKRKKRCLTMFKTAKIAEKTIIKSSGFTMILTHTEVCAI